MKKIVKFGKSIKSVSNHKKVFFDENFELLSSIKKQAKIYCKQPKRKRCKNCNEKILKVNFVKLDIPYSICKKCGHLNGLFEETLEFIKQSENSSINYSKIYISNNKKNYMRRMNDIYLPKANFCLDVLNAANEEYEELEFIEIGSGVGYLVKAFMNLNVKKITGYESSVEQVIFANTMIPGKKNLKIEFGQLEKVLLNTKSNVVCMINVLEHLLNPNKILEIIKSNRNIKYLFFSVPLFSLCVLFELANPNIWHRHLAGTHTHLYSYESIKYFCKKYNFEIIGEWWFGSDFFDLYRQTVLNAKTQTVNDLSSMNEELFDMIDDFQMIVDKRKISSDVHMVIKV